MEGSLRSFDKRQKAVRRKHMRMARGYVTKIDSNNLIHQRPDNKVGGIGLRFLFLLALAFLGFKTLIFAGLGPEPYAERVSQLQLGSHFEQAGAWLMYPDPITVILAGLIAPLLG